MSLFVVRCLLVGGVGCLMRFAVWYSSLLVVVVRCRLCIAVVCFVCCCLLLLWYDVYGCCDIVFGVCSSVLLLSCVVSLLVAIGIDRCVLLLLLVAWC